MIRILAVCPVPADGTAWWRVVSPLSVMRQDWPGFVEFEVVCEPDHVKLSGFDLLLLQRPVRDGDLGLLRFAKKMNIPVIVDYDDDYTGVPEHNPRAKNYMTPSFQEKIKTFLSEASLVTVSTPALKKRWRHLNKRIIVVPNGLDDRLFVPYHPPGKLRPRTVVWRGGDSHQDDLNTFRGALVGAAQTAPVAMWHFLGNPAGEYTKLLPRGAVVEHPFYNVLDYFGKLAELRPHILVVPLVDSAFNQAKSNISILEGSWAGAVVVAPKWPGWEVPGVASYESPAHMQELLIGLLRASEQELQAMRDATWNAVRERALASRFNMFRAAVFTELVKESKAARFDRPSPILTMKPSTKDDTNETIPDAHSDTLSITQPTT